MPAKKQERIMRKIVPKKSSLTRKNYADVTFFLLFIIIFGFSFILYSYYYDLNRAVSFLGYEISSKKAINSFDDASAKIISSLIMQNAYADLGCDVPLSNTIASIAHVVRAGNSFSISCMNGPQWNKTSSWSVPMIKRFQGCGIDDAKFLFNATRGLEPDFPIGANATLNDFYAIMTLCKVSPQILTAIAVDSYSGQVHW